MIFVTGVDNYSFAQEIPMCNGIPATITNEARFWVNGTPGNDVIVALEGNMAIFGGEGDDIICSNGVSTLRNINGGEGNDTCYVTPENRVTDCEIIRDFLLDNNNNEASVELDVSAELVVPTVIVGDIIITNSDTRQVITDTTGIRTNAEITTTINNTVAPDRIISFDAIILDENGNQVARNGSGAKNVLANTTEAFLIPIQFETAGNLTLTVNANLETLEDGFIEDPFFSQSFPITVTLPTDPTPTDVFIMSNPRVLSGIQNDIVTTINVDTVTNITVDINNGFDRTQEFVLEAVITTGSATETITRESRISAIVNSNDSVAWIPIKTGTANITVNIFDNLTDRNELSPAVTTSVTIQGEEDFTTKELETRISVLEAAIIVMQQQIAELQAGR